MLETRNILYVADMARYLDMTESAVRSAIQRKRRGEQVIFPNPMRIGNRVCWKKQSVDAWLDEQEAIARAAAPKRRGRPRQMPPEHP